VSPGAGAAAGPAVAAEDGMRWISADGGDVLATVCLRPEH
jgi:hypothetical protein